MGKHRANYWKVYPFSGKYGHMENLEPCKDLKINHAETIQNNMVKVRCRMCEFIQDIILNIAARGWAKGDPYYDKWMRAYKAWGC